MGQAGRGHGPAPWVGGGRGKEDVPLSIRPVNVTPYQIWEGMAPLHPSPLLRLLLHVPATLNLGFSPSWVWGGGHPRRSTLQKGQEDEFPLH